MNRHVVWLLVATVVGWLAEFRRPHGFAISETQFQARSWRTS